MRAYAGNAVSEFSDDIVESNGVGYRLKTGLGLRRDIAPLSAIAPPRVERDLRYRNNVNHFSVALPDGTHSPFRRWNQTPTALLFL